MTNVDVQTTCPFRISTLLRPPTPPTPCDTCHFPSFSVPKWSSGDAPGKGSQVGWTLLQEHQARRCQLTDVHVCVSHVLQELQDTLRRSRLESSSNPRWYNMFNAAETENVCRFLLPSKLPLKVPINVACCPGSIPRLIQHPAAADYSWDFIVFMAGESSDLCFRDVQLQLVALVLISLVGGRNLGRVRSS